MTTGTHPRGSSWAKNPIPRGNQFPPPCGEDPKACGGDGHRTRCKCSGAWGPYNLEIVDKVRVPKVPAGDWVVGFRWVSRHDIAVMWVAFFQECQQHHCDRIVKSRLRSGQAVAISPLSRVATADWALVASLRRSGASGSRGFDLLCRLWQC